MLVVIKEASGRMYDKLMRALIDVASSQITTHAYFIIT